MEKRFIGLENLQDAINRNSHLDKIVISSTFLDESKEVEKQEDKDFYSQIVKKISVFSRKFPHTQFAIIVNENKITKQITIHVKPIHGTA
jgi:hypothetical protein